MAPITPKERQELRNLIGNRFSMKEFQQFTIEKLNVHLDHVVGDGGLLYRAAEFIAWADRHGKIPELYKALAVQRELKKSTNENKSRRKNQENIRFEQYLDLSNYIRKTFLPERYIDLHVNDPSELSTYSALFARLLPDTQRPQFSRDFLSDLCAQILQSRTPYALRIEGNAGSGKSSLLSLLYLFLEWAYLKKKGPLPVLISLGSIEAECHSKSESNAREVLQAVLEGVLDAQSRMSAKGCIFLLDGFEEFSRDFTELEHFALEFIHKNKPTVRHVLGVSVGLSSERIRRVLGRVSFEPNHTLVLEGVALQEETISSFLSLYDEARGSRVREDVRKKLLQITVQETRAGEFGLRYLDLLTLSILISHLTNSRDLDKESLASCYRGYCSERSGEFKSVAQLAFERTIVKDVGRDNLTVPAADLRLCCHDGINNFLVAWHIVGKFTDYRPDNLDGMDYVYPQNITRFCREILNETVEKQLSFMTFAETAYESGGAGLRAMICYLAGRVKDYQPRVRAKKFLKSCKDTTDKLVLDSKDIPQAILLHARTVYISLIYLGDSKASDRYIELLLTNQQWNDLNRGFHLEYYGDLPFIPKEQMSHTDPVAGSGWTRTYTYLLAKIQACSREKKYNLYDVDVMTLLSLAQHRHASNELENERRETIRDLCIELLSSDRIQLPALRSYISMMRQNLEQPSFPIARIAEILYRLKFINRRGWVKRGVRKYESVAAHTFGAFMLGVLFLPSSNIEWKGYDKYTVLGMVVAHDLAESIVGDLLPEEKTEETARAEADAFLYLGMLRSYSNVHGLGAMYDLWSVFEHPGVSGELTTNALIARDLDRLDALLQLYIFKKEGEDIPDFNNFRKDLVGSIQTEAGSIVRKIIEEGHAALV